MSLSAVALTDYVPVEERIQFNAGDTSATHTIIINQDLECERAPNEQFFSSLSLLSESSVTILPPRATITIDDRMESECGKK